MKRNPLAHEKWIPQTYLCYLSLMLRIQRSYVLIVIVEYMTWHASHRTKVGCIWTYVKVWKYFDRTYLDLVANPCKIHLSLCTYGFSCYGSYGKIYLYWPIMLTPYNLPLGMCIKYLYMFLILVIFRFVKSEEIYSVHLTTNY